jgi:ABC-type multidrug transport system ATPase subunit
MTTQEIVIRNLPLTRLHQPDNGVLALRCSTGVLNIVAGRNGSGKTTLLDILAMRRALGRKGEIRRNGHSRWSEIAYLPQNMFGLADITVRSAIRLAARRGGDLSMATTFIQKAGIPMRSELGRLSGGQTQFLSFALVASQTVPVYIYDEPFRHLDETRVELLSEHLAKQVRSDALVISTDNEGRLQRPDLAVQVVIDLDSRQPASGGVGVGVTCA